MRSNLSCLSLHLVMGVTACVDTYLRAVWLQRRFLCSFSCGQRGEEEALVFSWLGRCGCSWSCRSGSPSFP